MSQSSPAVNLSLIMAPGQPNGGGNENGLTIRWELHWSFSIYSPFSGLQSTRTTTSIQANLMYHVALMICGIRIVRWQPHSQEELLCLHCSGQPHPQVERTLSWVISRWSLAKKTIYLTNISQDTKYVVINRGGELVYRGWTSSLIRQENTKNRFHFLNSVHWSAKLVML